MTLIISKQIPQPSFMKNDRYYLRKASHSESLSQMKRGCILKGLIAFYIFYEIVFQKMRKFLKIFDIFSILL